MSDPTVAVVNRTTTEIKEPELFDVVFYNDNQTSFEFVVLVLIQLFHKQHEQAVQICKQIHEQGRGAVATYTYEIAASKRDETVSTARANGYPLRVEIEPRSAGND